MPSASHMIFAVFLLSSALSKALAQEPGPPSTPPPAAHAPVVVLPANAETELQKIDDKVVTLQLDDYAKRVDSRFALFAHHRTFLIPYSYVTDPSESTYAPYKQLTANKHDYYENTEAEFQISLFLPVYRKILGSHWDLNVAYSHHSYWQVYNAHWSKPFRETSYNPEVFFRRLFPEHYNFLGVSIFALDAGYMHESNGQIQIASRSWDRLFTRAYFLRESYRGVVTVWGRMPVNAQDDQNPGILDYRGYGLLELSKAWEKITLETQINIAKEPGVEVSVSYPLNNAFRWFVKVNKGYGQSLIEYDRDTTRFGAGIALENYNDNR
ncbi:MAG: hypothetical protein EOP10_30620 [Proteobacteria bacterium]|nr:MAG: hypothetical protein EOP10_30620 [Pseudomonadota bacterium]